MLRQRLVACAPALYRRPLWAATRHQGRPAMPLQRMALTTTDRPNVEEAMGQIEELFSVAKDEMEFAQESEGSIYYHEDRAAAQKAVNECLDAFDTLLKDLPDDSMRDQVRGKIGMKMRELKAEFDALPEEGD